MAVTAINTKYKYNYNAPYSCDVGDLIRLFATFADINNAPIDPGTIKTKVKKPDGSAVEYSYPAHIMRTQIGEYYLDVNVDQSGTWFYRWETGGAGQAAAERTFTAKESYFTGVVATPVEGTVVSYHYDTTETVYSGAPARTNLKAFNIPSDLIVAGKMLHVTASGRFAANGQQKTISLWLGSAPESELSDSVATNNGGWVIDVKLTYRSPTELLAVVQFVFMNSAGVVVQDHYFPYITPNTFDFIIAAESPADGNVTQNQLVAYLIG